MMKKLTILVVLVVMLVGSNKVEARAAVAEDKSSAESGIGTTTMATKRTGEEGRTPVYQENEYVAIVKNGVFGREYFDRKKIDIRKLTMVSMKGTIADNLNMYRMDKVCQGYIKAGNEIIVESMSNEWAKVMITKMSCYVRTEELERVFTQTGFVYEEYKLKESSAYIRERVALRSVPSQAGEEIAVLENGREVTLTGKARTAGKSDIWFRICCDGREGYVPYQYVGRTNTVAPTSTPKPTSTPTPTPKPTSTPTPAMTQGPTNAQTTTRELSAAEKEAEARKVAMEVAIYVLSVYPCESDWVKINEASKIVAEYCSQCTYTMEGKDYCEAYGVFVKGEFSCAGATRALGMVLDCMGYDWVHANPNQYSHQWCIVEMDGQTGWADGQGGFAAYGVHPMSLGQPVMIQRDGTPKAVDANGNEIPNIPPQISKPEYNPPLIKQQIEEALKASGTRISIKWLEEHSLAVDKFYGDGDIYFTKEQLLRDLNHALKDAGLYTATEYISITVQMKEAGEIK